MCRAQESDLLLMKNVYIIIQLNVHAPQCGVNQVVLEPVFGSLIKSRTILHVDSTLMGHNIINMSVVGSYEILLPGGQVIHVQISSLPSRQFLDTLHFCFSQIFPSTAQSCDICICVLHCMQSET